MYLLIRDQKLFCISLYKHDLLLHLKNVIVVFIFYSNNIILNNIIGIRCIIANMAAKFVRFLDILHGICITEYWIFIWLLINNITTLDITGSYLISIRILIDDQKDRLYRPTIISWNFKGEVCQILWHLVKQTCQKYNLLLLFISLSEKFSPLWATPREAMKTSMRLLHIPPTHPVHLQGLHLLSFTF